MDLKLIWDKAQPFIKNKIGSTSYETWFSSLHIKEKPPNIILIEAPDEFFKNWIAEHYYRIIKEFINDIADQPIHIDFDVNPLILNASQKTQLTQMEEQFQENHSDNSSLNPRFSFENFVVGPSNRFAYAACQAVAESPAKAYNPLFIYGQVGLGKTHLMQAITHHILSHHPKMKSCYLSSEKFTNELIDAIRHRSTSEFRSKYRNIDILLIDDIHFIAGKESTQEEFFHTFNSLHNNRKQIIISSDRSPKEIIKLEERLSSRFTWGLITDIQAPDFETRAAILRKKAEREPIQVPENVILFIAEQIQSNIRELEGALIRVVAYALLEERPISLEVAQAILKDMVKETAKIINVETIQKAVSEFFNISLSDIKAKNRSRNLILPRQIAMYLSRRLTNLSLPEIGKAFGGKDHTTVLHSCKKIDMGISQDIGLQKTVTQLTTELKR
jgi:chromosomal replication initiator protein